MARKKIVFVIVEGPSDAEALDAIISRIFDKSTVHVHIMHGDITSDNSVNASNVISKTANEVISYAKSNHLEKSKKTFFQQIIHLVDMDGIFVPNDRIIADDTIKKTFYSETEIRTCNKAGIEQRNQKKRSNIQKLSSCKEIWGLPYSVFYMSCNLDHVLYNKPNSSDKEKEWNAYKFAKQYKDKTSEFIAFISESDFSVMTGYRESWDYIKQNLHSLKRYTNFGLCFQENTSPKTSL